MPRVLNRTLLTYLAGRFAVGTAMTMLRAAIAWHVFALTHSPFHLGLIGLVQFAPAFALTLVAGALADHADRRRIMLAAQMVSFLCGVVLFLATARGAISLPLLYALVVAISTASTFDSPARMAFLPSLVGRVAFPRVATIASTNQALAFATGPALGGLLIATGGLAAAYGAYACLILVGGAALWRLPSPPAVGTGRGVSLEVIREGLRFVRQRQVVLGCMVLDMFAVIFGGATALLPVYASDILHVGPTGYGLLTSALEVGALSAALVMMAAPPIRQAGATLLVAVVVYGLATMLFGISRSFPLSLIAYALVGVADQVSVVMRATAIQLATPDELRGRVSAVNMLFIGASNQLGAAESGFLAALTSAPFAVVSGGVAALVVVAIVAVTMPELRRYRAA